MEQLDLIFLAIGSLGALLVLTAFIQHSRGRWQLPTWQFELTNFIGAFCLFLYAMWVGALPNILLNLVWIVIAINGLWRIVSGKIHKHSHHRKGQ